MEPTVIWGALASVIATLSSALAYMFKTQVKELKETIAYERAQKETEIKFGKDMSVDTLTTMKDLVATVESIGPVVETDGGKTRDKVTESSKAVIDHITSHNAR